MLLLVEIVPLPLMCFVLLLLGCMLWIVGDVEEDLREPCRPSCASELPFMGFGVDE